MANDEVLEIVDRNGNVIGTAPRSVVHSNPALLHRVVHVLVFHQDGRLLLQTRSKNKDVAPSKWDTSVGGHVAPAEDLLAAALREMFEELGVRAQSLLPLYAYIHSNPHETELVHSYECIHNEPFYFDRTEIDDLMFWGMDEVRMTLGKSIFSKNFESEITRYLSAGSSPFQMI